MKLKNLALSLLAILLIAQPALADKQRVARDSTSVAVDLFVPDSSSSVGAGLTGLVFNTGSLVCYYHRNTASSATAISLVTKTLGTWTSGGFVVVDGTNMPGLYQLDIPNAAFANGAASVVVMCKGAANMVPVAMEFTITNDSTGQFQSGSTTTAVKLAAAETSNTLTGALILIDSGTGAKGVCSVGSYDTSTKIATCKNTLTTAPSSGDFYTIIANDGYVTLNATQNFTNTGTSGSSTTRKW